MSQQATPTPHGDDKENDYEIMELGHDYEPVEAIYNDEPYDYVTTNLYQALSQTTLDSPMAGSYQDLHYAAPQMPGCSQGEGYPQPEKDASM